MQSLHTLSRRGFLASASLACAAGYLAPSAALAVDADDGLVERTRKGGAAAKIVVHSIRENVSMLEGSGGNIAVLHGREGKLLIDAGMSKANILVALESIG